MHSVSFTSVLKPTKTENASSIETSSFRRFFNSCPGMLFLMFALEYGEFVLFVSKQKRSGTTTGAYSKSDVIFKEE